MIQWSQLIPVMPELVLAGGALVLLMLGAFMGEKSAKLIDMLAVLLIVVALVILVRLPDGRLLSFNDAFILDSFAKFMKSAAFIGSAVTLLMSMAFFRTVNFVRFEYAILILLATVGMGMMISANDLIALYMGLELMSLSLYVVAAIDRDNLKSSEAGLKYFVLGALSSGMLLYGASIIYGMTGTTAFAGITKVLAQNHAVPVGLVFGLVFMMAGFAFKISAVPFHMWTPDVYEGAPTPVTAFFASAPKMAAMALLLRVVTSAFGGAVTAWQQIIIFIALASMLLGAFAAIGQRNIKRLLAYSSIGHMGFALVGLAAANQDGVRGVIVYMAIYLIMTLGTFACVMSMRTKDGMVEDISDLAGLSKTNPMMAFLLAMLLFSLAGIPPLAGFFAKYVVFLAAIKANLLLLSIVGVLASVVGAFYYIRLVKIIYFDEPVHVFEPMPGVMKVVLAVSGVFVVGYIFAPSALLTAAGAAAKSLF